MKKNFKKIISLILTLVFMLQIIPVGAFAVANEEYDEAINFIQSKGFSENDVSTWEKLDNGIKFTINYLPTGESSYLTYIKETDGEKLIISEGNKQNELFYKNNGQVYLDGERYPLLENYTNNNGATTYSTVAISCYETFEEVPGYNYWKTQTFKNVINLDDEQVSILASMTVGAAALAIAAAYGIPSGFAGIVYNTASLAIQAVASAKLTSAILVVRATTQYMNNPTTLQYLYKVDGNSFILDQNLRDVFYRLESYN